MGLLEKSVILKCDELAHAKTGIREQRNDCFATPRKIHMEGIDFRAGSRDHDVPSGCNRRDVTIESGRRIEIRQHELSAIDI